MTMLTAPPPRFDAMRATRELMKKETVRDRQKRQRIENIIEIAVELFAQEGLANFSMRRIAGLAGITLSTLQHHFGNQKNLLTVTINSIGAQYMEVLDTMSHDTSIPPRERLDRIIDRAIEWAIDPLLASAYFELYSMSGRDKDIAALIDEVYFHYYGILGTLVGEVNPALSENRAKTIGVLIGSQMDGLAIFRQHGGKTNLQPSDLVSVMKVGWYELIGQPELHLESPPVDQSDGDNPLGHKPKSATHLERVHGIATR